MSKGRLVCVSLGMKLGAHISPICKAHLQNASKVFFATSNPLMGAWIKEINPNSRSLNSLYEVGKSRLDTYREMHNLILTDVRAGEYVCAAFYGHAGVFAKVPHQIIRTAKQEGYQAHMEPGISAEDCLYADMSIDPGKYGCLHLESSQFLLYKRVIDTCAFVILWQIGIAGDINYDEFGTNEVKINILKRKLLKYYEPTQKVYIYKCGLYSFESPAIQELVISDLDSAKVDLHSTLVIPPRDKMEKDYLTIDELNDIS